MDKALKIVLMVCAIVLVLAIAGSMIYYFASFKPNNERAEWEAEIKVKEEQLAFEKEKLRKEEEQAEEQAEEEKKQELIEEILKRQEEADQEEALANCLSAKWESYNEKRKEAFKEYQNAWDFQCKQLGRSPGCSLPVSAADMVDEKFEEDLKYIDEVYEKEVDACYRHYSD